MAKKEADTGTALAKPGTTEMEVKIAPGALSQRPDRIAKSEKRGMETMTKDDISIPRLALAQNQSPQVTEGDPRMIEGLKPGDLFNSLTKENYGREVFVQILRKDKMRAIQFRPIEDGGGIIDPNVPLDDERCKWHGDEKPVATVFRDYLARIIHPDGRREMVALSFKSSGLSVAKSLNGLIAVRNASIFDGIYVITTATNLKPQPHKIYQVQNAGWASDEDAAAGAELYEAMKSLDLTERIDRGTGDDDVPDFEERAGVGAEDKPQM